ncbi:MAG TPA: diadenylate cyclase [archaeon]|jgi:hypothetical protein|nr:diadenylate cyclase [archaeon]
MRKIDKKNNFNKKTIAQITALVNEMANKKKGSFFIITKQDISSKYERLYPDLFSHKKINIKDKETQTLLIALAELDGAIVVDDSGYVIDYGVKIKRTKILLGHGTRHSAARGISQTKNVLPIISSEEDGRVRIFREGEMVAEINPRTGKDKQFFEKIGELFSRPDLQVATAGGVASLLLRVNPFMAGAVFTGSWIITKYGLVSMKEFLATGRLVVKKKTKEIKKKNAKRK